MNLLAQQIARAVFESGGRLHYREWSDFVAACEKSLRALGVDPDKLDTRTMLEIIGTRRDEFLYDLAPVETHDVITKEILRLI